MQISPSPVRVLVLGSTGRIGKMLRRSWAQMRDPAVSFTYQTRTHQTRVPGPPDDLVWDLDRDPPQSLWAAGPFDAMIVLAGVTPGPGADVARNVPLGVACVDAAARLDIPRVLLASTSAVYGTDRDTAFSEDDPCRPQNDYGRAKRKMEEACAPRARAAGVGLCCLRIGNVAGADALLINGAALTPGETLTLDTFADGGTPRRSYIGPHSLARVLLSLVRHPRALPEVLNIAAPHPVTMGALARAAGFPLERCPAKTGAHQHVTLDCNALTALHRFGPAASEPAEMIRQWREVQRHR